MQLKCANRFRQRHTESISNYIGRVSLCVGQVNERDTKATTHTHTHTHTNRFAMHVAPLFDIVEILRNLHLRCHILGLIWVFVVLHADSNHCVQCLSPSAIYRSAAPPQSSFSSTTALVTPNTEPLSRGECQCEVLFMFIRCYLIFMGYYWVVGRFEWKQTDSIGIFRTSFSG